MYKSQRELYLDYIKLVALFFVAWAHFVSVGTFAPSVPYVLSMPENISERFSDALIYSLPIIPQTQHSLWKLESFLYNGIEIQLGMVGVVLFFFITGFLCTDSQKKYNVGEVDNVLKLNLFTHRLLYFWPTVFFTLIISSFVLVILFKINLNFSFFSNFVFTATFLNVFIPSLDFLHIQNYTPIVFWGGVNWFLNVLVFFFFISTYLFSRYSVKGVLICFLFLYFLLLLPKIAWPNQFTNKFAYYAPFCGIILTGSFARLTEQLKFNLSKLILSLLIFSLMLGLFKLRDYLNNSFDTYSNLSTYLFSFVIVVFFKLLDTYKKKWLLIFYPLVSSLAKLFLPFYLLHVIVGLPLLSLIYNYLKIPTLSIIISICLVLVISSIVYKFSNLIENSYSYKRFTSFLS